MIFFFDNCVPPRIGQALCVLGKEVRVLREEFKPSTPDTEWMPVVEQRDWIVITEDNRIRRRDIERAMLKGSTLRMVFLPEPFGREQLWDKVIHMMQWWPSIEEACAKLAPGCRLVMKTKKGKLSIEPLEKL